MYKYDMKAKEYHSTITFSCVLRTAKNSGEVCSCLLREGTFMFVQLRCFTNKTGYTCSDFAILREILTVSSGAVQHRPVFSWVLVYGERYIFGKKDGINLRHVISVLCSEPFVA